MTLKYSWTILNAWSESRFEEAVALYQGSSLPATPAMRLGSLKHKQWQDWINKQKTLPPQLGSDKLVNPVAERKLEKRFDLGGDTILLRGVPDCVDGDTIFEFKCGQSSASSYIDKLQLNYMQLLVPNAKEGRLIAFNPYNNTHTLAVKYLTPHSAQEAVEHLITNALSLTDYLKANGLAMDYK